MAESEEREGRSQVRKGSPEWPSIDEQLVEARAVQGSALEQVIRENQDFEVLDPHEAKDTLDYPVWLRVHWRKAHPEMEYSPDDPSGGYPHALGRIHAWMLGHQDLKREGPDGQDFEKER